MPTHHKDLHVFSEAIAVAVVAPVLGYIAITAKTLPSWQRWAIGGTAAASLLVDGYLLIKWLEGDEDEPKQLATKKSNPKKLPKPTG